MIVKLLFKHTLWKNATLYYLKTLNLITYKDPEIIATLKKLNPLLPIVSVVSGKRI